MFACDIYSYQLTYQLIKYGTITCQDREASVIGLCYVLCMLQHFLYRAVFFRTRCISWCDACRITVYLRTTRLYSLWHSSMCCHNWAWHCHARVKRNGTNSGRHLAVAFGIKPKNFVSNHDHMPRNWITSCLQHACSECIIALSEFQHEVT